MRLIKNLKNIFVKFFDKTLFDIEVEKSKAYLQSFPEPNDDIERGYFQYCCQMQSFGKLKRFILTIASGLLLLYYNSKLWLQKSPLQKDHEEALLLFAGDLKIIPSSLTDEFIIKQIPNFQDEIALINDDRSYIHKLMKRFPLSWYFIFKCTLKIAMYRYLILSYSPEVFICSEEYSFTSSVLTNYCERIGIEHINIMHGEKLFNIRDSFFRFNRCYIWDEFYRNLFIELRTENTQFIIEKPPSQLPWEIESLKKKVDYTYYLQKETNLTLASIHRILMHLYDAGFTVAIRPHPIQSDIKRIKGVFNEIEIEDTNEIRIEESVLRSKHVVSLYSTVLSQALANNVPIIIDDITRPNEFAKLKELKYICLQKAHSLLSVELSKF